MDSKVRVKRNVQKPTLCGLAASIANNVDALVNVVRNVFAASVYLPAFSVDLAAATRMVVPSVTGCVYRYITFYRVWNMLFWNCSQ